MPERIDTPFSNEHFVDWLLKMEEKKSAYWYGSCVFKANDTLLRRKSQQYPEHYGAGRMARYRQDIANRMVVSDCVGGCKGYAWTNGGNGTVEAIGTDKTFSNVYGSHGCPDKSANGMFEWAKSKGAEWGTIDTLPEIPGLALRKDGHVGYYVGNGYAVEWMGFNYGCVKTRVKDRPWTHWYKLPFIDYGDTSGAEKAVEGAVNYTLGSRLLKHGSVGTDVKALQELLNQLGASLSVDSEYGDQTERAVKAFQKKQSLKQDGLYGEKTHAALMAAVSDDDTGRQGDHPAEAETDPAEPVTKVIIVSEGGKVNIRKGNSTAYGVVTTAAPGTTLDYVAAAANGWNAVVVSGQVGWVSGKYSRIQD